VSHLRIHADRFRTAQDERSVSSASRPASNSTPPARTTLFAVPPPAGRAARAHPQCPRTLDLAQPPAGHLLAQPDDLRIDR
jgi:hypothetical protein